MTETIASKLARLRKEKGFTQSSLAKASGVTQSTIGNIESGLRGYGASIVLIAKALDTTPNVLLCEDSQAQPTQSIKADEDEVPNRRRIPLSREIWQVMRSLPPEARQDLSDAIAKLSVNPDAARWLNVLSDVLKDPVIPAGFIEAVSQRQPYNGLAPAPVNAGSVQTQADQTSAPPTAPHTGPMFALPAVATR